MAMATDLGLNRGVVPPIPAALAMRNPKIAVPTLSATRTLEERRTFLGCFFLTSMYVVWAGLLESELQQLRSSLVEGERQNAILLLHFYAIEIFLYQTALNGDVEPALYGMYPFSRLHILYACLNSTKLCFETAYTLPPSQWFDLPWSAEGWDQEYVRRTINFSGTMDALAQQLDIARVLAESQSFQIGHNQLPRVVPQVFLTYSAKLRRVKASHEAKYMAQSMNSHPMPDLPPMDALDIPTDDDFAMPYTTFFCDFLDESFWQQFT
ncbi:hypothetical protein H2202_008996 [Exophiala xenobiotica]|nr:hypothetical protein H2202_008996 [Exophiala xenobiotica]